MDMVFCVLEIVNKCIEFCCAIIENLHIIVLGQNSVVISKMKVNHVLVVGRVIEPEIECILLQLLRFGNQLIDRYRFYYGLPSGKDVFP